MGQGGGHGHGQSDLPGDDPAHLATPSPISPDTPESQVRGDLIVLT